MEVIVSEDDVAEGNVRGGLGRLLTFSRLICVVEGDGTALFSSLCLPRLVFVLPLLMLLPLFLLLTLLEARLKAVSGARAEVTEPAPVL